MSATPALPEAIAAAEREYRRACARAWEKRQAKIDEALDALALAPKNGGGVPRTHLSATEACERLRVSRDTLTKLIKSGDLKASKVGSHPNSPYRIAEADVDAYMERQAALTLASP